MFPGLRLPAAGTVSPSRAGPSLLHPVPVSHTYNSAFHELVKRFSLVGHLLASSAVLIIITWLGRGRGRTHRFPASPPPRCPWPPAPLTRPVPTADFSGVRAHRAAQPPLLGARAQESVPQCENESLSSLTSPAHPPAPLLSARPCTPSPLQSSGAGNPAETFQRPRSPLPAPLGSAAKEAVQNSISPRLI